MEIPFEKGLDGHSDADVMIHAIADALLGAVGERDIGHHFPNKDERWRGVSSLIFLEEIVRILEKKGAVIENIDATLISEAPKIGPYREEMQRRLATSLKIQPDQIGIKATTNELLGFIGRGEGISAMAVASVQYQKIA